jgi:hypothetical protein
MLMQELPTERRDRRANAHRDPQQQVEIFIEMLRKKLTNKARRTTDIYIAMMRKYFAYMISDDSTFLVLTCYESKGKSEWRGIEDFPDTISNGPAKIQFLSAYIKV